MAPRLKEELEVEGQKRESAVRYTKLYAMKDRTRSLEAELVDCRKECSMLEDIKRLHAELGSEINICFPFDTSVGVFIFAIRR